MYAVIGSDCSLVESGIGGGENTSAPKSARMTTNDTEAANSSGDSVNELSAVQLLQATTQPPVSFTQKAHGLGALLESVYPYSRAFLSYHW